MYILINCAGISLYIYETVRHTCPNLYTARVRSFTSYRASLSMFDPEISFHGALDYYSAMASVKLALSRCLLEYPKISRLGERHVNPRETQR